MLRFISTITAIFWTISSFCQAIVIDRIEPDGERQIMTSETYVKIGGVPYAFNLKAYFGDKGTTWALVSTSEIFASEGDLMLIKLKDGTVLQLHVNNVKQLEGQIHLTTYHYDYYSETYVTPSKDNSRFVSLYPMDGEQIYSLQNQGIKKIRIAVGQNYLEQRSRLKKLSKWLSGSIKMIQEQSQKPVLTSNDIKEGF